MHWLEHFLTVPTFRGRTPYLLLGVSTNAGEVPKTEDVGWAGADVRVQSAWIRSTRIRYG